MSDRLPISPLVSRAIDVATAKLGVDELARRLGVSETLVMAWRDGSATIPRDTFLRLVDELLELRIGWDDWDGK